MILPNTQRKKTVGAKSIPGWCSTPTYLLICSSFNRENGCPLLLCSSLSTAQLSRLRIHHDHQIFRLTIPGSSQQTKLLTFFFGSEGKNDVNFFVFCWFRKNKRGGVLKEKFALLETNISPENRPLEKEIPIGNHHI